MHMYLGRTLGLASMPGTAAHLFDPASPIRFVGSPGFRRASSTSGFAAVMRAPCRNKPLSVSRCRCVSCFPARTERAVALGGGGGGAEPTIGDEL